MKKQELCRLQSVIVCDSLPDLAKTIGVIAAPRIFPHPRCHGLQAGVAPIKARI
jgi:hypothetical protein